MNILFLPDASRDTLTWFNQLQQQLHLGHQNCIKKNHRCSKYNYSFWHNDSNQPSLSHEISQLPGLEFDLVIAKSLGILIFLQAAVGSLLSWKKALLVGIPLRLAEQTKFNKESLNLMQNPNVHIVQQRNDKLCPCNDLIIYQPKYLLQIAGSDHNYNDFSLYANTFTAWINQA